MPSDEEVFDRLVGEVDYPMLIVTASIDGDRSGCLVGFSTQCSIHPRRFIVCISKKNHTFGVARGAGALGVHFLSSRDHPLAAQFGEETGDEVDKFEDAAWHEGPEGVPVLDEAKGWFVGRVVDKFDVGDHVAFLLEPVAAGLGDAEPGRLGLQDAKDLEAGHPA